MMISIALLSVPFFTITARDPRVCNALSFDPDSLTLSAHRNSFVGRSEEYSSLSAGL
jgi:hypothetical protein